MNTKLRNADHLLSTTYTLVKDPKLLLGVLQAIATYYKETIQKTLELQGIPPLRTLQGQLEQLKSPGQLLISKEHIQAMERVFALEEAHKQSPVAFRAKTSFHIYDTDYGLKKLTIEKLKHELQLAKDLDEKLDGVL